MRITIFITGLVLISSLLYSGPKAFTRKLILMGTAFEVTVVLDEGEATRSEELIDQAVAEIRRIENLLSSWLDSSQTSRINRSAGVTPVRVDRELFDLIERSKKVSQLSEGAFDISFASIDRVWRFDGSMQRMPEKEEVLRSVEKIDYRKIILNPGDTSVFLPEEGMKIGFGAIGKGYAANQACRLLRAAGVQSGVINASGDLLAWGEAPEGGPWKIGIADPVDPGSILAWFRISDMAVVTSGNYESYVEFDGVRYSHIIDPRTGWPVKGLESVTVVCPDAEIADALATAIFVLGREIGLDLVNQLKGVECLMIDEKGKIWTSDLLQLNYEGDEGIDYFVGDRR